ncbi:MAG: ATP synthase subunit I [Polaromonas sp. 39-63-203]|jgi:ATP synthase protein I|uniref:ATP synthase subunit I n=1 Tax=Polaromonas sp. TaxID=1869339 RepID=UPI000BD908B5|nr:ATP synthase subunit I [Polaromonas sp.]OYZ00532.1 MAG: ATP synthase subunit I [Polaromonas sp. 28-63-22]OYZ83292.1 MAG: ATP synthase subunit I [Polaromonas sp. 24-62-144]OZA95836.1 MAG: ATP synthase subunit I [Polaromonas sp. 39-63-203]HQS33478.1 ATP synthase subunit I [Polaromonas sp.]HQS92755.1 ATP synthase subunit I [Polaromonas sp.]
MSTLAHSVKRSEFPDQDKLHGKPEAVQPAQVRPAGPEALEEESFKPLTRQEAAALRRANPSVSPWEVLAGQLAAGVVLALVAGLLNASYSVGWSALYGALAVVLPGALFARGLTSKVASMNPGAAVAGFFLWEMVKVGLTVAMLFAAPRWVPGLSWPAMLVGLVVTMKVVWLVLLLRARPKSYERKS